MMFLFTVLALLLISVLPGHAQQSNQAVFEITEAKEASPTVSAPCSAIQIQNINVPPPDTCVCLTGSATGTKAVTYTCPPNPTGTPMTAKFCLKGKDTCSDDANMGYDVCSLWFHSLCWCIQMLLHNPTKTNCKYRGCLNTCPKPKVWMLLERQDLITTTEPLQGILELQNSFDPDGGWTLGQENKNSSQALAMNSLGSRSQEQIHIHVCSVVTGNLSGDLRSILTCRDRSKHEKLTEVPDMPAYAKTRTFCKVSPKKFETIRIARDIQDFIVSETGKNCKEHIGAGIITDSWGFTWGCVTYGTRAAEYIFCN
jgi:hypothetical protein